MGRSTPTTAFYGQEQFDTLPIQCRHIEHMHEGVYNFCLHRFAYAIIGHTWANQLLPQLLMEQFDTFPIQCRHIEHMHEGVYNFCLHRFYSFDGTI